MTRLTDELAHMTLLLSASATSSRGWRPYLEDKAQRLAAWDPQEYSELPQKLSELLKRLASNHSQPKQPGQGTS